MPYLLMLVLIAVLLFIFVVGPRLNELFLISIRDGELLVVRGRVPTALLQDIAEIATRHAVEQATVRALRGRDGARLATSGLDDGVAQRLRNSFHLYPVSKLAAAPLIEERNLGQVMGIVWLAWMLRGSMRTPRTMR
jgi:hypothetical protein